MACFSCCINAEITPNNLSVRLNKNINKSKIAERKRSKTPDRKKKLHPHQKEQVKKSVRNLKNYTENKGGAKGKEKKKEKEQKTEEHKQKNSRVFNKKDNNQKVFEKKIQNDKKSVVINKKQERENSFYKTETLKRSETQTAMDNTSSSTKAGKMECIDDQWKVSNYKNVKIVNIDNVQLTHSVSIFNNENTTFVIKGDKFKSLQIQNCQKCNIVLKNVISSIGIIDAKKIKVQVTGKCSSITIDKTIGVEIYLSKENVETEFTTALSAEMNVHVEGNSPDEDWKEITIPEQYQHVLDKGNLTTRVSDLYKF